MNSKALLGLILIIVLAVGGYYFLTMPDNRTTGQKIGDAAHDLGNGSSVTDAGRDLESRTPGEKLGDKIKDAGDSAGNSVKNSTSNNNQ